MYSYNLVQLGKNCCLCKLLPYKTFTMSSMWIPSDRQFDKMCSLCRSESFEQFKEWITSTRNSRQVCKQTFCPAGSDGSKPIPLVLAAQYGNAHIVKYLLTEFSDVVDVNEKGSLVSMRTGRTVEGATALWAASCENRREIAQLLLISGANVNTSTTTNSTPMRVAAFNGHYQIMELLYSNGADINIPSTLGQSPLLAAAICNRDKAIMFLLERGANVSQKTINGYTVFHVAAAKGHTDIIRTLQEQGLSPNFELTQPNTTPCPLFLAAESGHRQVIEQLFNVPACTAPCKSEVYLLLGAGLVGRMDQQPPIEDIMQMWRKALKLRNKCGYVPKYLPSSEVYAGLSEVALLEDLPGPPEDCELDASLWIRYQALMMRERIVGPSSIILNLVELGSWLRKQNMFRHAELLWLRAIESDPPTALAVGAELTIKHNVEEDLYVYARGVCDMVEQKYQPEFSKFVKYGLGHFAELLKLTEPPIRIIQLILWLFASWIQSDFIHQRHAGNKELCSNECEELGTQFVTTHLNTPNKSTLLHLAVSNFLIKDDMASFLFGNYYQSLIAALLRWGADKALYILDKNGHYPIHLAVNVSNEYHVNLVLPLLECGCSPLIVDSMGKTCLQWAKSNVVSRTLRSALPSSLFCLCCVAIVKYGISYELQDLPSAVKKTIRLFDKNFVNLVVIRHRIT